MCDRERTIGIRVVRLRIPTASSRPYRLFALAIGVLFSYLFAVALQIVFLGAFAIPDSWYRSWLTGAIIVSAATAPALFLFAYHVTGRVGLMRSTALRTERLEKLIHLPELGSRLPHRVVERCLRDRYFRASKLRRYFLRQPRGRAIVIDRRDPDRCECPRPLDLSFEPVETADNDDRIELVVQEFLALRNAGAPSEPQSAEAYARQPSLGRRLRDVLWRLLGFVGLAVIAVNLVLRLFRGGDRLGAAVVVVALGLLFLIPLFYQRRWWIVPGGLVFREDRIWNRTPRWGLVTPADSPFLMDWRDQSGDVVHNGRVMSFQCNELTAWLAVAAWINTSPPPTLDSVRTFLGLD